VVLKSRHVMKSYLIHELSWEEKLECRYFFMCVLMFCILMGLKPWLAAWQKWGLHFFLQQSFRPMSLLAGWSKLHFSDGGTDCQIILYII